MKIVKSWKKKAVAALAVAGSSVSAFAVDHSTAITAAGSDGTTNTTAAVVAVLGIAAVVTGVGIVYRLLTK